MRIGKGRITEVMMASSGDTAFRIDCPLEMVPTPGAYLLAHEPGGADDLLAWPLFLAGDSSSLDAQPGALLQPGAPGSPRWAPGFNLSLRGPLGRGFNLPSGARRIALAALGDTASRLLALIHAHPGVDAALFAPAPAELIDREVLPAAVEIQPLSALPEAVPWAQFLAIDLPLERLPDLRQALDLSSHEPLPCPGQALVLAPMPCAGVAECGACAVPAGRSYQLACVDGPVFDLEELKW
jgi:NAD(P)H-flavin reductase